MTVTPQSEDKNETRSAVDPAEAAGEVRNQNSRDEGQAGDKRGLSGKGAAEEAPDEEAGPTDPDPVDPGPQDDHDDELEDLTGQILSGRYLLEERIGEGAMGAVYRATHTLMKKTVAIKLLHADLSERAEISERFQREAQAAAHIEHPNVCGATDFGKTDGGDFFLVMEFLEGSPLNDVLENETRLSVARSLDIIDQVAAALQAAHELNIVHRDLKPDNIFLVERDGREDFVKIVDFGIAHVRLGDDEGTRLTQAGMVYGTPQYLSPEQAVGEEIDHRADLYAMGIVLFEMLAGRPPFTGDNIVQLIGKHVTAAPPLLTDVAPNLRLPPGVEALISDLLAKSPEARPADIEVVRRRISEIQGLMSADFPAVPSPQQHQQPGSSIGTSQTVVPSQGQINLNTAQGPMVARNKNAALKTTAGQRIFDIATDTAKSRPWLIPALGVGLILLVVILVAALRDDSSSDDAGDDGGGIDIATPVDGTPSAGEGNGEERSAASDVRLMLLETSRGEPKEAIEKLKKLKDKYGENPEYLAVLASTQFKADRSDEAVESLKAALEEDPEFFANNSLAIETVHRVLSERSNSGKRELIELLQDNMTIEVAHRLGDIAMMAEHRAARKRSHRLLEKSGFLTKLEPWEQLSIDLRSKDRAGCTNRRPVVEKITQLGDPRALPVILVFHEAPKKGCGIFDTEDCQSCMREELQTAVDTLRAKQD